MKSDVVLKYKFLAYCSKRSMQGRGSCLLDPATLIQEQKYTVYGTFADCLKMPVFNLVF